MYECHSLSIRYHPLHPLHAIQRAYNLKQPHLDNNLVFCIHYSPIADTDDCSVGVTRTLILVLDSVLDMMIVTTTDCENSLPTNSLLPNSIINAININI